MLSQLHHKNTVNFQPNFYGKGETLKSYTPVLILHGMSEHACHQNLQYSGGLMSCPEMFFLNSFSDVLFRTNKGITKIVIFRKAQLLVKPYLH